MSRDLKIKKKQKINNTEREHFNILEDNNLGKIEIVNNKLLSKSEQKNKEKEKEYKPDITQKDINENRQNTKLGFDIEAIDLENLMGKYKERGSDFQDLK